VAVAIKRRRWVVQSFKKSEWWMFI